MADRYCKPHNAGLASETPAVCRRIGKLITALDTEINAYIVEGKILSDVFAFRNVLIKRLEADGWTFSYDGGNRMKVRQPGHARPFHRRQIATGGK